MHRPSEKSGFTLNELLIVIAIVSIIAALLIPGVTRVRNLADQSICLSNLRQVGVAMQSYIADHDGYLPGPIVTGQKIYYDNSHLTSYLYPYLGGTQQSPSTSLVVKPFVCPRWLRVVGKPKPTDNIVCYIVNHDPARNVGDPFGYTTKGTLPQLALAVQSYVGLATDPKKCSAATPYFSMSETYMITEGDQVSRAFDATSGWYSSLPKTPLHPAGRNTLFFDFHAEARPLNVIP